MTTKDSSLVTNYEASPTVMNPTQELHGRVRIAQGTIALATGDLDNNDIVMLAPVPKGCSITSIQLASDDLDSNGTPTLAWNVGVYETDGTVVDEDCYATAITLGQAATAFTEYRFEAANITTTGQKVWEDAGVSSDPGGDHYYIALTASAAAATAAAGDIAFKIEYVVD